MGNGRVDFVAVAFEVQWINRKLPTRDNQPPPCSIDVREPNLRNGKPAAR